MLLTPASLFLSLPHFPFLPPSQAEFILNVYAIKCASSVQTNRIHFTWVRLKFEPPFGLTTLFFDVSGCSSVKQSMQAQFYPPMPFTSLHPSPSLFYPLPSPLREVMQSGHVADTSDR